MDFITSYHFDQIKSDIKKEIKNGIKNEIKNEIKEEIKFETDVQQGLEILEKLEFPIEIKISQETNENQDANGSSFFKKNQEFQEDMKTDFLRI